MKVRLNRNLPGLAIRNNYLFPGYTRSFHIFGVGVVWGGPGAESRALRLGALADPTMPRGVKETEGLILAIQVLRLGLSRHAEHKGTDNSDKYTIKAVTVVGKPHKPRLLLNRVADALGTQVDPIVLVSVPEF